MVKVYRKWILQEKPVFMEEPDKKEDSQDAVVTLEDSVVQTDGKHVWYQRYFILLTWYMWFKLETCFVSEEQCKECVESKDLKNTFI